jgi:hypothetical protein
VFGFWAYAAWLIICRTDELAYIVPLLYCCQLGFELIQFVCLFWFSRSPLRDLGLLPVVLCMPAYHAFLKLVDLYALTEELLFRASSHDNFVPEKVRAATWRW